MVKDPRKLAGEDGRYSPEAFEFLFAGLDQAVKLAGRDAAQGASRHVSGQELLEGMKHYARELFGPLAAYVWRSWGIRNTRDWGNIVFLLVEAELLNRQEGDTIQDFEGTLDFDEFFATSYQPELPEELGAQPTEDD
jgi:uncharacterized repeat protein (TIGR04138 family)